MEKHYTYKTFTCLTAMCQFLNEKGLELNDVKLIRDYPSKNQITMVYNEPVTMIVG